MLSKEPEDLRFSSLTTVAVYNAATYTTLKLHVNIIQKI